VTSPRLSRARARGDDGTADDGTAIVEFVWLGMLLLVPLVYVILFAFAVQRAAFAATESTRTAARAFVTTPNGDVAVAAARSNESARLTLDDHGVPASDRTIVAPVCRPAGAKDSTGETAPCFTPGSAVVVEVDIDVQMPVLPAFGIRGAAIRVHGIHREVFDKYTDYAPPVTP